MSKFLQLFVFVLNCLLFPYSLHFLFEGCTLSESVGSIHTIHQLLPVAFAVGSWLAVRHSLWLPCFSVGNPSFQSYRNVSNTFWQYPQPSFLQIMYPDVQMVTIECTETVIQRHKLWFKSNCHTASVWICWIIQNFTHTITTYSLLESSKKCFTQTFGYCC